MTIDRLTAEEGTVWSLLMDGATDEMLIRRVAPSWFLEWDRYFSWVLQFIAEYGKLPEPSTFAETWKLDPPTELEPFAFYAEALAVWNRTAMINAAMMDIGEALDADDVYGAGDLLVGMYERLTAEFGGMADTDLAEPDLAEIYERRQAGGEIHGRMTGFRAIDTTISGLHDGQLITLVGPPKAGKTYALCSIAAHLWESGAKVVFVTFEMSQTQIRDRIISLLAQVNHTRLRLGTMHLDEMKRVRGLAASWEGAFIITATDEATVPAVAAKIVQHRPDVLIIDGVYFMDDAEGHHNRSSQSLTSITRGLKRLAMKASIPVVAATQVLPSRYSAAKGISLDSIGYSSSFGMDSDLVLGVDTPDPEYPEMKRITVVAARDAPMVETTVIWDWETTSWTEEDSGRADPEWGEGSRGAASVVAPSIRRPTGAG